MGFHNLKRFGKNRWRCYYCAVIVFVVLLCSCKKNTRIILHVDTSSEVPSINDLKVVDGKYEEALNRCQEKLKQVEKGSIEEADIYSVMGGIHAAYLLDKEKALFYINKAIETHQREEDEIGLAQDYTEMSTIYTYIGGDVQTGLDYLEKVEQIYYKYNLEDSNDLAEVFTQKGHLYLNNAQYDSAIDALINAQKIYEKKQESSIYVYILTGQAYLEKMEYQLAEAQYLKAMQICELKNELYYFGEVKFQLGWLYRCMEKYDEAIENYSQSLNSIQSSEVYLADKAVIYNNMAYCYDQLQEAENALEASIQACQLIEEVEPVTSKTIKSQELYKHNLSEYWLIWYQKTSKDEFESWYREVVLEGK